MKETRTTINEFKIGIGKQNSLRPTTETTPQLGDPGSKEMSMKI